MPARNRCCSPASQQVEMVPVHYRTNKCRYTKVYAQRTRSSVRWWWCCIECTKPKEMSLSEWRKKSSFPAVNQSRNFSWHTLPWGVSGSSDCLPACLPVNQVMWLKIVPSCESFGLTRVFPHFSDFQFSETECDSFQNAFHFMGTLKGCEHVILSLFGTR